MSTLEKVAEARQNLDAAQAELKAEQRRELIKKYQQARKEVQEKERLLRQMANVINGKRRRYAEMQERVDDLLSASLDHLALQPSKYASTDDPELRRWQKEHDRIAAKYERALQERNANDVDFETEAAFHKLKDEVVRLQCAVRNLETMLEGRHPSF